MIILEIEKNNFDIELFLFFRDITINNKYDIDIGISDNTVTNKYLIEVRLLKIPESQ